MLLGNSLLDVGTAPRAQAWRRIGSLYSLDKKKDRSYVDGVVSNFAAESGGASSFTGTPGLSEDLLGAFDSGDVNFNSTFGTTNAANTVTVTDTSITVVADGSEFTGCISSGIPLKAGVLTQIVVDLTINSGTLRIDDSAAGNTNTFTTSGSYTLNMLSNTDRNIRVARHSGAVDAVVNSMEVRSFTPLPGVSGTFAARLEFMREAVASGATRYVFDVNNRSYDERVFAAINTSGKIVVGGQGATSGITSDVSVETIPLGSSNTVAVLVSPTEVKFSLNGAAVVTVTRTNLLDVYNRTAFAEDATGNTGLNAEFLGADFIPGTLSDSGLRDLAA